MQKVIKILLCLSLFGCTTNSDLKPNKYVAFMEDNDKTRQTIETGGSIYSIQLATPDYMACRELSEELEESDLAPIRSRAKELEGYVFFIINIGQRKEESSVIEDIQKKHKAGEMIMYYQSAAANDIILYCDDTQVYPATYHYEDNYGLAPYNTIITGFKVPKLESDLKLVFNDRYNNNLFIQASYSKNTLENLPTLGTK